MNETPDPVNEPALGVNESPSPRNESAAPRDLSQIPPSGRKPERPRQPGEPGTYVVSRDERTFYFIEKDGSRRTVKDPDLLARLREQWEKKKAEEKAALEAADARLKAFRKHMADEREQLAKETNA